MGSFKQIVLLLRVSHWSKAIFVLLGVIYAGELSFWPQALMAAFAFCLIASAVYIYNDIQDLEEDRVHPKKSRRPLASREISVPVAVIVMLIFLGVGFLLAFIVSKQLITILGVYLVINLAYNHWLRNIPIFDVLCIASGFMLRILAGTIGIGLPITWWLTLTATLLSLFIALCKRRLEMQLQLLHQRRAVLKKYHPRVLDLLILSTAISCFITYLLYIMYARNGSLYFLLTLPFVILGLWRFTGLTKNSHNDDPISLFFSDHLSQANLLCFFILTMMALMRLNA